MRVYPIEANRPVDTGIFLGRLRDDQIPLVYNSVVLQRDPSGSNETAYIIDRAMGSLESKFSLAARMFRLRTVREQAAQSISLELARQKISVTGPLMLDIDNPLTVEDMNVGDVQLGTGITTITRYVHSFMGLVPKLKGECLKRMDVGLHRDEIIRAQVEEIISDNSLMGDILNTTFLICTDGIGKIVALPKGVEDIRKPIAIGNQGERFVLSPMTPDDFRLVNTLAVNLLYKASSLTMNKKL